MLFRHRCPSPHPPSGLHSTLGTFLGPRRPPRPLKCSLAGCEVPRAPLRGSQFCLGHHVLKFVHGPPPQLSDWLRNADYALLFRVRRRGAPLCVCLHANTC